MDRQMIDRQIDRWLDRQIEIENQGLYANKEKLIFFFIKKFLYFRIKSFMFYNYIYKNYNL